MHWTLRGFTLLATFFFCAGCAQGPQGKIDTKDTKMRASYALGYQVGRSIKTQDYDVDINAIAAGISDFVNDRKMQLSDDEMKDAMRDMRTAATEKRKKKADENLEKGKTYLEANKKRPGVKVTKSGLQYEILKAGTGKSPTGKDRVKVHYKGTLTDGTEFDSSFKRDKPAEFHVRGVIKGWTEALMTMKTGGKWKLHVPPALGYGPRPRPRIPANSVLIFEVELLDILPTTPKMPPPAPKKK